MGSSTVYWGELGETPRGFWTRDEALTGWLSMCVQEMDRSEGLPAWMSELREKWYMTVVYGGVGCLWTYLDEYITSQERAEELVALCRRAMTNLLAFGEFIPLEVLNTMPKHIGSVWLDDAPIEPFARVGRCLIRLLRGELHTTISDMQTFVMTCGDE